MKWFKCVLAAAAAVTVAGLAAYRFQGEIVSIAAPFLIDSDGPEKADLIYILGGNYSVRAPFAAKLYREGWAPKILLAREASTFTDATIQILKANGVPQERIVDFSPKSGVKSTADEAHALKLYTEFYPVRKVLVVTTSFHGRRARMAMNRALLGRAIQVRLVTVEAPDYSSQGWRATEYGRHQVKMELIKSVYYFFTFWG